MYVLSCVLDCGELEGLKLRLGNEKVFCGADVPYWIALKNNNTGLRLQGSGYKTHHNGKQPFP